LWGKVTGIARQIFLATPFRCSVFTGVFHTNKEAGTFRNKPLKQLKPQNSPFFVTTEHLPVRQTLVAAPKNKSPSIPPVQYRSIFLLCHEMKTISFEDEVISIKKIFMTISFKSTHDKLRLSLRLPASIYAQKIIRDTLGST
jgi:hypothetical protein